jgi:fructose-bisphosphate aldolase class II
VDLLARHYGICVVLHTDHANRKLIPWVEGMIEEGERHHEATGRPLFSSHMLDLSEEPLADNLSACAAVLERLQPLGMSLEIELGVTGGEEDGVGSDDDITDNPNLYTQPEDVLEAHRLLSPIGHFSIAASFGNVHGVYKPGNVQLRPEILKNSQALVAAHIGSGPNPLDLVFHGGSGSEKDKIEAAIDYGVFKMNIDTDTQFAFATAVGAYAEQHAKAFKHQVDPEDGTPYKKLYDPRKWLRLAEQSVVTRLDEAFRDLRAVGKSLAEG